MNLRHKTSFVCVILFMLSAGVHADEAWYPFPVYEWDPPFVEGGQRKPVDYAPLEKSSKAWRIGVFIPHLKDSYWLAVNYGLVSEAKRLGIRLEVHRAGGYDHADRQLEQIAESLDKRYDGLIVSAVSFTDTDSLMAIAADAGIPCIDLINGMSTTRVAGRSVMPYYDAGESAGKFLAGLHPAGSPPVKISWFPGPKGPGWTAVGNAGFREAIKGTAIEIVDTRWGDTGKKAQTDLLTASLQAHPAVDYVVGTSVTAEAAERVLRRARSKAKVVAYYFSPGVYRGIQQGKILGAPTDSPAIQARIAIDQVVRILEGKPVRRHVGTRVHLITQDNVKEMREMDSLAPTGFIPTYTVN